MSKKKRPRHKPFKLLPDLLLGGLAEAETLMERKRWAEARDVLEELDRLYPERLEVLTELTHVNLELGDTRGHLWACERLSRIVPPDPDITLTLAGSSLLNGYPARALLAFRRFVELWPRHEQAAETRQRMVSLSALLDDMLKDFGEHGEDGLEIAALHEEARLCLEHGKWKQGRRAAETILSRRPNFIPALNNLSQMAFLEGEWEEAVQLAERVLALDPANFHALGNAARYLYLSDRTDEATQRAAQFKELKTDSPDSWTKKLETLASLGDDEGVLEVFREAERTGAADEAILHHWAAVALMRSGREDEARKRWRTALKLDPGLELAQENVDDLRQPAGQRHAPWPLAFNNWLSRGAVEDLYKMVEPAARRHDEKGLKRGAQRFVEKHPEVIRLVPVLLDRGDPAAREFALRVTMMTEHPEMLAALRDFALSQRGPDAMRLQAANVAADAGLLPAGEVRLWITGKWQELMLMGFEIHYEPVMKLRPKAARLVTDALMELREGGGEEAESLLKRALEIEPDSPAILNNLAAAYELQGRKDEAMALEREIHERFPDYLFTRVGLARKHIADGQLDEAAALLNPLLARRRIHIAEYSALCQVQIELLHAQKNTEGARSWLEMWAGADPEHPGIAQWRLRLGRGLKEKLSAMNAMLTGGSPRRR
ncbi:MAG: tetratricopeptide repeat protein [Pyrinomonadaceae bacterium]